jgi:hypothetical protein
MSEENVELQHRVIDDFNRRDSGAAFERTMWLVAEWRTGKIVWWGAFASEAEALDAVRLSE